MKHSITAIDPGVVAYYECEMWKAYYAHRFLKLCMLLYKFQRSLFGLNFFQSLALVYNAGIAAMVFRLHKGKETDKTRARIRFLLERFYTKVHLYTEEPFDVQQMADKEMHWWFVDRYPERYDMSRESALAESAAVLYSVDPNLLHEYATYRAKAMVLQDLHERGEVDEVDWSRVEEYLMHAYHALRRAVGA